MPYLGKSYFPRFDPLDIDQSAVGKEKRRFIDFASKILKKSHQEIEYILTHKIWTCKISGTLNLTYEEALTSELTCLRSLPTCEKNMEHLILEFTHLSNFPLDTLTHRAQLYVHDNFQIGSKVYFSGEKTPGYIVKIDKAGDTYTANFNGMDILTSKSDQIIFSNVPSKSAIRLIIRANTYRSPFDPKVWVVEKPPFDTKHERNGQMFVIPTAEKLRLETMVNLGRRFAKPFRNNTDSQESKGFTPQTSPNEPIHRLIYDPVTRKFTRFPDNNDLNNSGTHNDIDSLCIDIMDDEINDVEPTNISPSTVSKTHSIYNAKLNNNGKKIERDKGENSDEELSILKCVVSQNKKGPNEPVPISLPSSSTTTINSSTQKQFVTGLLSNLQNLLSFQKSKNDEDGNNTNNINNVTTTNEKLISDIAKLPIDSTTTTAKQKLQLDIFKNLNALLKSKQYQKANDTAKQQIVKTIMKIPNQLIQKVNGNNAKIMSNIYKTTPVDLTQHDINSLTSNGKKRVTFQLPAETNNQIETINISNVTPDLLSNKASSQTQRKKIKLDKTNNTTIFNHIVDDSNSQKNQKQKTEKSIMASKQGTLQWHKELALKAIQNQQAAARKSKKNYTLANNAKKSSEKSSDDIDEDEDLTLSTLSQRLKQEKEAMEQDATSKETKKMMDLNKEVVNYYNKKFKEYHDALKAVQSKATATQHNNNDIIGVDESNKDNSNIDNNTQNNQFIVSRTMKALTSLILKAARSLTKSQRELLNEPFRSDVERKSEALREIEKLKSMTAEEKEKYLKDQQKAKRDIIIEMHKKYEEATLNLPILLPTLSLCWPESLNVLLLLPPSLETNLTHIQSMQNFTTLPSSTTHNYTHNLNTKNNACGPLNLSPILNNLLGILNFVNTFRIDLIEYVHSYDAYHRDMGDDMTTANIAKKSNTPQKELYNFPPPIPMTLTEFCDGLFTISNQHYTFQPVQTPQSDAKKLAIEKNLTDEKIKEFQSFTSPEQPTKDHYKENNTLEKTCITNNFEKSDEIYNQTNVDTENIKKPMESKSPLCVQTIESPLIRDVSNAINTTTTIFNNNKDNPKINGNLVEKAIILPPKIPSKSPLVMQPISNALSALTNLPNEITLDNDINEKSEDLVHRNEMDRNVESYGDMDPGSPPLIRYHTNAYHEMWLEMVSYLLYQEVFQDIYIFGLPIRAFSLNLGTLGEILRLSFNHLTTMDQTSSKTTENSSSSDLKINENAPFVTRVKELAFRLSLRDLDKLEPIEKYNILQTVYECVCYNLPFENFLAKRWQHIMNLRRRQQELFAELKQYEPPIINKDDVDVGNIKEKTEETDIEANDLVTIVKRKRENVESPQATKLPEKTKKLREQQLRTEMDQIKSKLAKAYHDYKCAIRLRPIGTDRHNRRYWKFPYQNDALYIEENWEQDENMNQSDLFFNTIKPTANKWYWIRDLDTLDQLIANLNDRGVHESVLKSQLKLAYGEFQKHFNKTEKIVSSSNVELKKNASENSIIDLQTKLSSTLKTTTPIITLDDEIMTLEKGENVNENTLKAIKHDQEIKDTILSKTHAIYDNMAFAFLIQEFKGEMLDLEERLAKGGLGGVENLKDFEDKLNLTVEISKLGECLYQIYETIYPKFLKNKFAAAPKVMEKSALSYATKSDWIRIVKNPSTLSQLWVMMEVLDLSICWERSAEKANCKVCRRKETANRPLIICDNCDKAFHLDCLKPALKHIPEGEWLCPFCRPLIPRNVKSTVPSSKQQNMSSSYDNNMHENSYNSDQELPSSIFSDNESGIDSLHTAELSPEHKSRNKMPKGILQPQGHSSITPHTKSLQIMPHGSSSLNTNSQTINSLPPMVCKVCKNKPTRNNLFNIFLHDTNSHSDSNNTINDLRAKTQSKSAIGLTDETKLNSTEEDFLTTSANLGELILCAKCSKYYHMKCHIPTLRYPPRTGWKCSKCLGVKLPVYKSSSMSTSMKLKKKKKRRRH